MGKPRRVAVCLLFPELYHVKSLCPAIHHNARSISALSFRGVSIRKLVPRVSVRKWVTTHTTHSRASCLPSWTCATSVADSFFKKQLPLHFPESPSKTSMQLTSKVGTLQPHGTFNSTTVNLCANANSARILASPCSFKISNQHTTPCYCLVHEDVTRLQTAPVSKTPTSLLWSTNKTVLLSLFRR